MQLPVLNQSLQLAIRGKTYTATCVDLFDGGYGWYFDAVLPKNTRIRFKPGEQCTMPVPGAKCVVDFVGYPTNELWKVRFLIAK